MSAEPVLAQFKPSLNKLGPQANDFGGFLNTDTAILLGAILTLIVILIVSVNLRYSRRRMRRHPSRHKRGVSSRHSSADAVKTAKNTSRGSQRRRNSTLAETEGLPPLRSE